MHGRQRQDHEPDSQSVNAFYMSGGRRIVEAHTDVYEPTRGSEAGAGSYFVLATSPSSLIVNRKLTSFCDLWQARHSAKLMPGRGCPLGRKTA